MLPGNPLHPAHQFADVQRCDYAQHATDQSADNADNRALDHEDRHDLTRRGADGAQDGDVRPLVVHHHDQGGDDVECRHGHDHQQQQADHGFFHFHGTEQAALGVGPVIRRVPGTQAGRDLFRHLGRRVQVLDRQTHALHLVRLPVLHGRGIGHVDQAHGAVQFRPDLEDTDHIQALQARGNPPRRGAGLRHDQGDLVTDTQAKTARGNVTQHHAKLAGLQIFEFALHDVLGNDRNLAFQRRIDAADLNRLHRALVGQHAIHLGKRHSSRDLRILHRRFGHRAPVIDGLDPDDGRVRHHTENAVAHFTLKTVHH